MTIKIAHEVAGAVVPVTYENTYGREPHAGGGERLVIGLRDQHAAILRRLSALLRPPYELLYVLQTTRTGAPLGRYESPALDRTELGRAMRGCSRARMAARSSTTSARCRTWGFSPWLYGPGRAPSPHLLHYHAVWDAQEQALLDTFEWRRTAVHPQDMQF